MNSINHLEKSHGDIFNEILVFEEIIDREGFDYFELIYSFHTLMSLLIEHQKNLEMFLFSNRRLNLISQLKEISLDPRLIQGHVKVINDAIRSKEIEKIKISLDNDGRMLISRLKEYIFREEMLFDKILFLHLIKSPQKLNLMEDRKFVPSHL